LCYLQGEPTAQNTVPAIPSDSEIRKILAERIDAERQGVGMGTGVIEPSGKRVVSYGALERGDKR
jgi:hypothetical protein